MRRSGSVRAAGVVVTAIGLFVGALSLAGIDALAQSPGSAPPNATARSKGFEELSARADEARDGNRTEEAVKLYRKAVALNPKWAEGWWSLATLEYDNDRYAEAQLAFEKVVALDPKQGTARAMLGLCEFELGQSERALKDIEASKTLGVLDDQQLRDVVTYHEAMLQQRNGRFEAAKQALVWLCRNGPRSSDVAGTFGLVSLRMRDLTPPDPNTEAGHVVQYVGRAACLSGAKDFDASKKAFEIVIAQAPHFPLVHYAFGSALVDANDFAGAVREFEAEIAVQPKSVLPRLRIAAAEYKVDSALGLKYAEEAVQLEPAMPLAHYLLGLLQLDTGDYEHAVTELEVARKAFPNEARIDLSLSTAYAHVGRSQDALRARTEFARKKQSEQAAAQAAIDIAGEMDAGSKP